MTLMTHTATHANVQTLRSIYQDLSQLAQYITDDVVLHHVEPGVVIHGREAVLEAEEPMTRRQASGALYLDVEDVIANDHWGAVTGIVGARRNGEHYSDPFCALWRFRDGLICELWCNVYNVEFHQQYIAVD